MAHDPSFRNGFWFKTLARFYALNEYLLAQPQAKTLLIESDVWISPTFPIDEISKLDHQLGFPLTTSKQGVASTFFSKNQGSLQYFLDFAKNRVNTNPDSTDVTILADYREMYPERVCVFPSGPVENDGYHEHVNLQEKSLLSSQEIFKNQIFDGSTWGQFLTGEDPRNSWGYRWLYHVQNHHAVNPSKFEFVTKDKSLVTQISGNEYRINSLHIHSKDVRAFSLSDFLNQRVSNYGGQEEVEIVWRYFLRFLPHRIVFELRKSLTAQIRKVSKR